MPLNKTEISTLLEKEDVCYLATSNKKGNPHVKPIWFIMHNGDIWFETDYTTVAFKNIKQNNKIMICFGGKRTFLIWGKVEWYSEDKVPIPFRKMLWKKYGADMEDSYITEKTGIFKVIANKETPWHYADEDWE